ncbi:NlpC/P60 family protein [Paenibacillus aurantius]|uniref:NlpC/P60 family protein n=1 Tax=Paenibacillus aurantius TaxID=2918900 RepID=A0AA96LHC2_9BACL|nr:NlpC/P60 family protein [Paenibacillus aurantius]WNQ13942.1 NlpC/P60 family protein [Paenibacillus aurantius]
MTAPKRLICGVSVATVWTSPESVRPIDAPAVARPADPKEWIDRMGIEGKLDLCNGNRVQTQMLYGTPVLVTEEQEDWVQVLIPDQPTRKNPLGYPGWVPRDQLIDDPAASSESGDSAVEAGGPQAVVMADKAWLRDGSSAPLIELSFLTTLPLVAQEGERVEVLTPHGIAYLSAEEVRVTDGDSSSLVPEGKRGQAIVEQGLRFLDLPYLWGGMSSYGYDCSGFAYSMHRSFGILVPRDASDQAKHGKEIAPDDLEPGDLMFFAHEKGKGAVHHVGIYAGEGKMLHSPETIFSIELVDLATYKLAEEHCISRRYWE